MFFEANYTNYDPDTAPVTQQGIELMFLVMQNAMTDIRVKDNDDLRSRINLLRQYTPQQILVLAQGNEADATYLRFAIHSGIKALELEEELGMVGDTEPTQERLEELKKLPLEYFIRKMGNIKMGKSHYEEMQEYIEEHAKPEDIITNTI